MTFEEELRGLINKYCRENVSDTPDFILAEYLDGCLSAFDKAVLMRRKWHSEERTDSFPFASKATLALDSIAGTAYKPPTDD